MMMIRFIYFSTKKEIAKLMTCDTSAISASISHMHTYTQQKDEREERKF